MNCNKCCWSILTKPNNLYRICSNPKSKHVNIVFTLEEVEKLECKDVEIKNTDSNSLIS